MRETHPTLPGVHESLRLKMKQPLLHVAAGSAVVWDITEPTNSRLHDWHTKMGQPSTIRGVKNAAESYSCRMISFVHSTVFLMSAA